MNKKMVRCFVIVIAASLLGAPSCGQLTTTENGFTIHTIEEAAIDTFGFEVQTNVSMTVFGGRAFDLTGATGIVTAFQATTDINGLSTISGGRTNAQWNFTAESGPCSGQTIFGVVVFPGNTIPLICHQNVSPFAMSPSSVDGSGPPAVTLSGNGISTAYGMPQAWIIDANSQYVQQVDAIAVAGDGTWMTAQFWPMYDGTYSVVVRNVAPDGTLQSIGGVQIQVYNNPVPPPDDPCGGHYCYQP